MFQYSHIFFYDRGGYVFLIVFNVVCVWKVKYQRSFTNLFAFIIIIYLLYIYP